MKSAIVLVSALFLALLSTTPLHAEQNFYYSYTDPAAADASKYITDDSTNVELVQEGTVTYWKPIYGSDYEENTMPGIVYYHFPFDRTIKSGFLKMYIASFHWSYSQGRTFIYASTDGKNWIKLAEAPPPEEGKATWGGFDGPLPEALLHKRDLYLKAVLYSYGEKAYLGGAYTNTAQHSRYTHGSDVRMFELGVEFDDKWIQDTLTIKTTYTDKDGKQVTVNRLIPGQSSTFSIGINNPERTYVNSILTYGLHVDNNEVKTIGESDVLLAPGDGSEYTAKVDTPSDVGNGLKQLSIVLKSKATNEILDTSSLIVPVGIHSDLALGALIMIQLLLPSDEYD